MTYYNTTNLTGGQLAREIANCKTQEQAVLLIFQSEGKLSPSEVFHRYPTPVPLTSIRRAITNLTKDGLLEKTDKTKPGAYGKAEHVWQLTNKQFELWKDA